MTGSFQTVQLGTKREKGEGLRIGAVRYLPRGVRKSDYAKKDYFDVWLPVLAPSHELLHAFKEGTLTAAKFFSRYRKEMSATDPRQVIELLAELSRKTSLSVGCYCEDEAACHRSVLGELIREAQ